MEISDFNVGDCIKKFLKKEGRSENWLARSVYCDPGNFNRTLKKKSIDMDLLRRISVKLRHNFFADYARFVDKQIQEEMMSDSNEMP